MNSRLVTVDFLELKTQEECENICKELLKFRRLLCNATKTEIGNNDPVYYDERGLICEGVRRNQSLYLGTLESFQFWCQRRLGVAKDKPLHHSSPKLKPARQKKTIMQPPKKAKPKSDPVEFGTVSRVKDGPKTIRTRRAKKPSATKLIAKKNSRKGR